MTKKKSSAAWDEQEGKRKTEKTRAKSGKVEMVRSAGGDYYEKRHEHEWILLKAGGKAPVSAEVGLASLITAATVSVVGEEGRRRYLSRHNMNRRSNLCVCTMHRDRGDPTRHTCSAQPPRTAALRQAKWSVEPIHSSRQCSFWSCRVLPHAGMGYHRQSCSRSIERPPWIR